MVRAAQALCAQGGRGMFESGTQKVGLVELFFRVLAEIQAQELMFFSWFVNVHGNLILVL